MSPKKAYAKIKSSDDILLIALAILCSTFALFIAVKYAAQIPLDQYSFRQTQTAITAYYFVENGFSLAYETPVAGPPWSIPFEFPIYQYIVAIVSQTFGSSLNATGRLVSFTFLVLCLIPIKSIIRDLRLSKTVFYVFSSLFLSSPLYIYWGRTFMIETAAVFFCVVAIKFFIKIILGEMSLYNSTFFLFFIILSILQKSTTGLPVLAILSLVYIFSRHQKYGETVSIKREATFWLIYFGIPLAVGICWTMYTDQVKMLNELGIQLTSSALSKWNWGTIKQRFSSVFYGEVIWTRFFVNNLSGPLGIAVLLLTPFFKTENHIKLIVSVSICMGFLPLFLFTNLHIVHTYYQTSSLIFIIFAISVSIGHVINNNLSNRLMILVVVLIMVSSNYFYFAKNFMGDVRNKFNKENSRDLAIANIIKKEVPKNKYFIAFGNDWSSSLAYLSERKSFTVPSFYKNYKEISLRPELFIKEDQLGAIVLCPSNNSPTIDDLGYWARNNRNWKIGMVHGCYIAIPETNVPSEKTYKTPAGCRGNLDYVVKVQDGSHSLLSVSGWTTLSDKWEAST